MKNYSSLLLLVFIVLSGPCLSQDAPVFPLQTDGYACFRIPAMIRVDKTLLAFAEGRKDNCADFGNNDIVMKVSHNQGKSWSAIKVVVDYDSLQASNAAPVLDLLDPAFPGGRIFLFYNTGTASEGNVRLGKGLREVWYVTSTDRGATWSKPVNITAQVHHPYKPGKSNAGGDWRGYANTPGHALQLSAGSHKGRLFIAANHTEGEPKDGWADCFAHGFYSDDHGKTFHLSQNVEVPGSNEAIAAELNGGGVMLNARNQKGSPRCRIVARSLSGGDQWDTVFYDSNLVDPVCQASLLNTRFRGKSVILFANPASSANRVNLTVRMSFDEGRTWPHSALVVPGEAAYCDLAMAGRNRLGILFEKGSDGGIYYKSILLKDLKD